LNHRWAADVVDYHVRFREKTGGNVFVGLLDTPFFPVQTWAYMVSFASSLIESRDSISLSYRGDVELSKFDISLLEDGRGSVNESGRPRRPP
jgi:hypothetical protein